MAKKYEWKGNWVGSPKIKVCARDKRQAKSMIRRNLKKKMIFPGETSIVRDTKLKKGKC